MKKLVLAAIAAIFTLTSCSSSEGDGTETPRSKQVLGRIEKGPFVQGSEVTLTDLNKDLSQSGKDSTTIVPSSSSMKYRISKDGKSLPADWLIRVTGYISREATPKC